MGDMILGGGKFLFGVLLLPIVIAATTSFYEHIYDYSGISTEFFIYGLWGFLITFLFIYQFIGLYDSGQKMVGQVFSFTAPFDRFLMNLIPVFTILTLTAFFLVKKLSDSSGLDHYFMFFAGFTYAMHLILTAQSMQGNETSPIKPHYLLFMNIILILSIYLVVFSLDLVYGEWTISKFSGNVYDQAKDIYLMIAGRVTQ